MKSKNKVSLLLVLLSLELSVAVPVSGIEPFTIESAAARARAHNADLAAARLSIDEAQGRLQQAGLHANPELDSELKPNVNGREGAWQLGFTQKFPLTSRLRRERAVSRAHVTVAEAEVREAERKLLLEVRSLGVRLAALDAHGELRRRQIVNSRELVEVARKSAARGEGPALEAAQFELEAERLAAHQLTLDAERLQLLAELRPLLGLDTDIPIEFRDVLPVASAKVAEGADMDRQPVAQVAAARVLAAREGVELARAQRWDDAGIGLFYEGERWDDQPSGLRSEGLVGIRFTLPLPFWNRNEGRIQEAAASAARAEKEAAALAQRQRAEAAAARVQMATSLKISANLTTNLVPKAAALEERLRALLAQGQSQIADVLRAREQRLELESSQLDALREYHLARTRHESITHFPISNP